MAQALILRRGKLSRSSGQWQDEDYDVIADGKVIGRILEEGSSFGAAGAAMGMVDHRDRAGIACDARHRPRRTAPPATIRRSRRA
jgi:hypothetical protein